MTANTLRRGSRAWNVRRSRAVRLFASGEGQSVVARTLGVSRQCAHNWYWEWRGSDGAPRKRRRRPGSRRKTKLDAKQLTTLHAALRRGPPPLGLAHLRLALLRAPAGIDSTARHAPPHPP